MGLTSLQVCMDSSDWLQGTMHEDQSGMDSSSSPSGDMLTCSRPMIERRLRPPHDQALKCPRCDSTHTKFCYYNNYSLSQPRYFCKTCRRYWTKGGTLRNIPVGGGCRKNKKVSNNNSKKSSSSSTTSNDHCSSSPINIQHNPTDLHLSFPAEVQFSHLSNLLGIHHHHPNFMENPRPIDLMESKLEAIVGNSRNYDFMGNADHQMGLNVNGLGLGDPNFHGLCSPFAMAGLDGNNNGSSSSAGAGFVDSCQRLMLPYDHHHHHHHQVNGHDHDHHHEQDQHNVMMDVKPKLLSLEWQDQQQGCSDTGKDSFAYLNGMGSWTGMMNGYGSSATNPLV